MKATTELAISLSVVFGTILVVLALAGTRFAFRKRKRARSTPVDPVYERTKVDLVNLDDDDNDEDNKSLGLQKGSGQERWFGGAYGVTPVATEGPGGTAQYLGGWWGLDAPIAAAPTGAEGKTGPDPAGSDRVSSPGSGMRESHFSRASRASRRSALLARASSSASTSTAAGAQVPDAQDPATKREKTKKKPRVSKTSEFGAFEQGAGVVGTEGPESGTRETLSPAGTER